MVKAIIEALRGYRDPEGPVFSSGSDAELLKFPRYKPCFIPWDSVHFLAPDSVSFYYAFKEIIENEIYRFPSDVENPLILDCGANCGISILYFKKLAPGSRIVGVEADPSVFRILKRNVKQFSLSGVTLHHRALSNRRDRVPFLVEGADAGRVISEADSSGEVVYVDSLSLDALIGNESVDFLKMDIEGAEVDVLLHCKSLRQVKRMFVEYHSFRDAPQRLHELLSWIHDAGFRYYISVVETPKRPFEQITDYLGMDLQLNISCVRGD